MMSGRPTVVEELKGPPYPFFHMRKRTGEEEAAVAARRHLLGSFPRGIFAQGFMIRFS